jgi:hypothetical protein
MLIGFFSLHVLVMMTLRNGARLGAARLARHAALDDWLAENINRSLRFCSFGGAHHIAHVEFLLHKA